MKKIISCIIILLLLSSVLAACGKVPPASGDTPQSSDGGKKISIVATTFPQYDWTREILGDQIENVDLTLLLDNGVDLHSFQPSVDDIAKISDCDMFIYVGGESDTWVHGALEVATNNDMVVINMLEVLGDKVKAEEIIEGMEHDHEHSHDEIEHDEHVWLSLKNAKDICTYISKELAKLDSQNSAAYIANADAYNGRLSELDGKYQTAVDSAPVKTLLFGDRFPFRYMVDDYGLSYFAAFSGCSAETEASFETIVYLSDKANELNLKNIMVLEGSSQSIADTIIQSTSGKNQNILVLNSIQSVTSADVSSGTTYLSIMESNLEVLKSALY